MKEGSLNNDVNNSTNMIINKIDNYMYLSPKIIDYKKDNICILFAGLNPDPGLRQTQLYYHKIQMYINKQ